MVRWKPLLGKGKKEIACERAREREAGVVAGGRRGGEAESPLSAHPPIYGSPFSTRPFKVGRLSGCAFLVGQ